MFLFGLMVLERAVYMLGWPAAKMGLHLVSMAVVGGWCLRAFWASVAAAEGLVGGGVASVAADEAEMGVRWHLRVFVLLRCCSLVLGALQLRWGFPPLSSPGPGGGGRNSSFFYRRPDWLHQLAFNVFYARACVRMPVFVDGLSWLVVYCLSAVYVWEICVKREV